MKKICCILATAVFLPAFAQSPPPVKVFNPFHLPLEFRSAAVDPETLSLEVEMVNVSVLPVTAWSLEVRTLYSDGEESVVRLDTDLFLSAYREEQQLTHSPSARVPPVREGRGAFWPGQTLRAREGSSIDPERTHSVEFVEVTYDALVFSDGGWMGDEHRVDMIFGFRKGFGEGLRHFRAYVESAHEEAADPRARRQSLSRLIERLQNLHVSPSGPEDVSHGGFMNARRMLISDAEKLLREVEEGLDPQLALDRLLNVLEEEAQASDQHKLKRMDPERRKEW